MVEIEVNLMGANTLRGAVKELVDYTKAGN